MSSTTIATVSCAQGPPASEPAKRDAGTLAFGLEVLSCFTPEQPVLGVAELSGLLGASRSTLQRHARTLVELGFLEELAGHRYRLGAQAHSLGLAAIRCSRLSELVRPWLAWLRATTGFTVCLGMLDGEDLLYTAWLPSYCAGQVEHATALRAGWSAVPHACAAGKALLAFTAEAQWPSKTRAQACRTDRAHSLLLGELEQVCERGYAASSASASDHRCGIAAAILGASDAIAAVELTVFEPTGALLDLRHLSGVVVEAAWGIAEQLEEDSRTVA